MGEFLLSLPWYFWLFPGWVVAAFFLGPLIGKWLKRKGERMSRNAITDEEIAQRWKNPGDEEWRNRF